VVHESALLRSQTGWTGSQAELRRVTPALARNPSRAGEWSALCAGREDGTSKNINVRRGRAVDDRRGVQDGLVIDPEDASEEIWPTSELARLADQVRSPFLTLGAFLDEPADRGVDGPDRDATEEELALLAAGVTAERIYAARLRRAGVLWAVNRVVERCIEDLALQDWDPHTQLLVCSIVGSRPSRPSTSTSTSSPSSATTGACVPPPWQ